MVMFMATFLMHRYQQKGESLKESNFELSKCIQVLTNSELRYITIPIKIYMYDQILFNLAISIKTISHAHQILQIY